MDGWVYKISCSQTEGDFRDSDCIALCKEIAPVLKIAAIEDAYIWTATTSSTVNRWRDISFSPYRKFIVPESCFCKLNNIDEHETESMYSKPVSVTSPDVNYVSEPLLSRTSIGSLGDLPDAVITPLWPDPEQSIKGLPGIKKSLFLNNRRHIVTMDTLNNVCIWDIITCTKIKNLGPVDFDKACDNENTQEWVSNWCTIDTKHGDITVHLEEGKCYDSEVYYQDLIIGEPSNEDQRVNLAKWILTLLLFNHLKKTYPENISFRESIPIDRKFAILPSKLLILTPESDNSVPDTLAFQTRLASSPIMMPQKTTETDHSPMTAFNLDPPSILSPATAVSSEPQSEASSPEGKSESFKAKTFRSPSFMDKFKLKMRPASTKSTDESSPTTSTIFPLKTPSVAEKMVNGI